MYRRAEAAALAVLIAGGSVSAVWLLRSSHQPNESRPPVIESMPLPFIDLTRIPDQLPEAVAAQVASVVDISIRPERERYIGDGFVAKWYKSESYVSGVKIGEDLILTAGHALRNIDNRLVMGRNCGDFYAYGSDGINPTGAEVIGAVSQYRGDDSIPDVALLRTSAGLPFNELKSASISLVQPGIGEVVYFVNFQLDANGNERSPSLPDKNSLPAIFPGIVVGTTQTGDLQILTGFVNYGKGESDVVARGGSSGGAVFNEHGELVGISTRASNERITDIQVKMDYRVQTNYPLPDARFGITRVEPIDLMTVQNLAARLLNQEPCVPTPPAKITYLE